MRDKEYTSFHDILQEEFEIDNAIEDDEMDEDGELLDMIITDRDEAKADSQKTEVDDFLDEVAIEVNKIIEEERIEAMNDYFEFFDEDAEIFEESVDADIEDLDEIEDPEFENDLDYLDGFEGVIDVSDDEAFSVDEDEEE